MAHSLDIQSIQSVLRESNVDGWLFFDHHARDPLAYRILRFAPSQMSTRRWYYLVPAEGEPQKLCHRIESHMLDDVPGLLTLYSGWKEQEHQLAQMLGGAKRVAMQYSPRCKIPAVSMVDGGTVELIRSLGVEVASSANLIQLFEATLTEQQYHSHLEAGKRADKLRRAAFDRIAAALAAGRTIGEIDVKEFILAAFVREDLVTDHGPIVAVNENASDPHYEPTQASSRPIRPGDVVLIDMWAKLRHPGAVYYDITWTGYCGRTAPPEIAATFDVVAGARDAAIRVVQDAIEEQRAICGFEVDDAARAHIAGRGLSEYFVHRTGHSIGEDVHGAGANMDNFETHDERQIVPNSCFSIEPGVYLPSYGIRSEVNMFVRAGSAQVTGEVQERMLLLETP